MKNMNYIKKHQLGGKFRKAKNRIIENRKSIDFLNVMGRESLGGFYQAGGNISKKATNLYMDYYNAQPAYTEALIEKYKGKIPIKEILSASAQDATFDNAKLDRYAKELTDKYGDFYLTEEEMKKVEKDVGVSDIAKIDQAMKGQDVRYGTPIHIQTAGSKEGSLGKFGPRMLLQRSYPKGSAPYKYLASNTFKKLNT